MLLLSPRMIPSLTNEASAGLFIASSRGWIFSLSSSSTFPSMSLNLRQNLLHSNILPEKVGRLNLYLSLELETIGADASLLGLDFLLSSAAHLLAKASTRGSSLLMSVSSPSFLGSFFTLCFSEMTACLSSAHSL